MYIVFNSTSFYTYVLVHSTKKKSISFFCMICRKLLNFSPCQRMICNCNFWVCICIFFLMFSLKKNKYTANYSQRLFFFFYRIHPSTIFQPFFLKKKIIFLSQYWKSTQSQRGLYVIGRNLRYIRRPLKLFYLNLPFFLCVFWKK